MVAKTRILQEEGDNELIEREFLIRHAVSRRFPRNKMLVPSECLRKNKERAHRICEDCWWDPQKGFARENVHHGCPGCKKHLPLNPPIKTKKAEVIDISDSD